MDENLPLQTLYRERDDENAYSGGISLAFIGDAKVNSIVDIGFQVSDEFQEAVASFILRF